MKVIIAPGSFKGSLSPAQAARCIARGLTQILAGLELDLVPVADGGEGTVEAMLLASGGERREVQVTGPLGHTVTARFGVLPGGDTAVLEMAAASGLTLVPPQSRDPLVTTSYGTGELVRAALDAGCRQIILGLGGSATVDGGAGAAQALGASLLDEAGRPIGPGGRELLRLRRLDLHGLDPRLKHVTLIAAADVDVLLCGPSGAAAMFGPQKGATPPAVTQLDAALGHFALIVRRQLGMNVEQLAGGGAAGGLGAGLVALLGATLRPGADIVLETTQLERRLDGAGLVITGEGKMDGQTLRGKAPLAVARLARLRGIPVVALVGGVGAEEQALHKDGPDAILPAVPGPIELDRAMGDADRLLGDAAARLARLLAVGARLDIPPLTAGGKESRP
ncbi:MAG TPA: glycerate kinase [Bacillota bacterium]|nr:glycerate kinase [Bacillota bacterium]